MELKMNPNTNKFEELQTLTEKDLSIQKQIDRLSGEIYGEFYRPNGEPVPKHWSIFRVGKNYVINNYTFKCVYIGETSILFEPVGIVEVDKKTK